MLFRVTVCLLLCTEFISGMPEGPYRLGNANELESSENEISPDFKDLLFTSIEDENQSYEYPQTPNENYIETDHDHVKRKATVKKELSSSKDDGHSSKQSSPTRKLFASIEDENQSYEDTQTPNEDYIETDHDRVKRKATVKTVKKELRSSKDDEDSSKQSSPTRKLFASIEDGNQSCEYTQTPNENYIETDHDRVKRETTVKKELVSSKDDESSSKQSSPIRKSTPTPGNNSQDPKPTQRTSTTMRPVSSPTKSTVFPTKVTTKRSPVKPVGSSTEKARDNTLEDPKLIINDNEISNLDVYSKVNESLEVVCKSDSEIIEWRGPENPFLNNPIQAERIEKNKLVLKFKSIALDNGGNYTCKVSKKTTTKKKSFKLKVIDPVQIIEFPQNLTSPVGGNVTLQCKTSGHPKAIVKWSFNKTLINGSTPSIRFINQTNSHYKLDGDNLLIKNITLQESGRYMCEAKQDIEKGTTDNKTVDVIVEHKPFSIENLTTFEKAFNSIVEIPCKMISNPAANFTWFRKVDGIYQNVSLPSVDPVLKINLTNTSQYGEYKCQANNYLGYDEQYILLNPKEFLQPAKIEFIKVTESVVYFKAVPENDSHLTHYKVQYKKKDSINWTNRTITLRTIPDTKHKLTNLTEKTTYILRVRSVNEFGISAPSNEIEFTTKELPRPPTIKIKKLTNSLVYFNIIAKSNRTLTGYNVEYKRKKYENWKKMYFTTPKGATWNTKYYLSDLTENTIYILRVSSVNELGRSAPSNEIEFTTKELPRPPKIKIKKLTQNLVYFNAKLESNRTLIRYNAEYKTKDAKNWKTLYFTIPKGATWNTKYVLRNLNKRNTYILRVRSVNELGISAPSNEIEFTTFR